MLISTRDRLVRLLRRLSIGLHVPLALGLAYSTLRRMLTPEGIIDTDFTVFRSAWWLVLHGSGNALYDASAQRTAQRLLMGGREFEGGLMAFLNPPHAALAGLPLGWIADHAGGGMAFAIWAGVNLLLLMRLDHLVRTLFGVRGGEVRWTITVALLAFYPVFYTIGIGQLSLLLAVGAFELCRAVDRDRPRAAAAWLVALAIKPQLLPPILLLLALRSRWRTLGSAAVLAFAVAAICAAALGTSIWFDYARNLSTLEGFFAAGTPGYMMNVRGALTRVFDSGLSEAGIYWISIGAWIAAMLGLGFVVRRGDVNENERHAEFALALAVSLVFNPHVFLQDTVIWIVVLTLHGCALRARRGPWMPFAVFAFSWPLWFAISKALDAPGAERHRLTPAFLAMFVALVWILWTVSQTARNRLAA